MALATEAHVKQTLRGERVDLTPRRQTEFVSGFTVGIATSGLLCVVGRGVLFPTNEYRARLDVLLQSGEPWLFLALVLASASLAAIALVRTTHLSGYGVAGILGATSLNAALLATGGYAWLPEMPTAGTRISVALAAA